MKTITKRTLAAAAAVMMAVLTGCSSNGSSDNTEVTSAADTAVTEAAAAENTWDELDQTAITAAMGMGWNLGNQLEASSNKVPNETTWGNPTITEDLIKAVKAQGFNTIRIPVSYLSKIGEAPDYTIDSAWLDRVQEVVDYVVGNDMYAVINIHGDGYYTVDGSWLL